MAASLEVTVGRFGAEPVGQVIRPDRAAAAALEHHQVAVVQQARAHPIGLDFFFSFVSAEIRASLNSAAIPLLVPLQFRCSAA